ncbi:GNAT family protein [Serratia ficaria]|uniref:Ribosomal-protein-serine acetyltransferase n=1 Tax=Serratia ficaria TaxID=61651 RepID=A0A240BXV5_SERFI|nr:MULTISPECIES: GNAT family protein [Serratia]MEE4485700.1 GNAT family protein [Serratia ficaria]REF45118.1 RimJ/RimL family protein N-acetyltransferase [Serratia ficaria]CAI0722559.1 Ribosomal-protein-serine acetyltransferase [Serratia ficaria]CAI0751886.1 Ribosomal-protein-serine acetyltransferase [Serratia ficaria]CAI0860538.1 Ribosomal-protein-serine acetyltransferase [Serratia ficaria]
MRTNQHGQPVGEPLADWRPARRPQGVTTLGGRFCRLAPLDPQRDSAALFAAFQQAPDGRDWTYLPVERPESPAAMRQHLNNLQANDALVNFTVFDAASGAPVGTVAFMRIDEANGVLEIGHVSWSPAMKRRSSATEAIALMLRHAFDELGYRRCEWKCDSHNAPSKQAALRFGFSYEGCFRYAVIVKGRSRDTDWFAITGDRWPAIGAAFERWLSADNFDAQGRQKQRLQALRN